MKLFKMTFAALVILAAIAIALGAYWHIYTLGMCAAMVYAIRKEEKATNQKPGRATPAPIKKRINTQSKKLID